MAADKSNSTIAANEPHGKENAGQGRGNHNEEHRLGVTRAKDSSATDGASRLLRLADLAHELGDRGIEEAVRDLAGRIAEERFYVACIGQFKRGKSTLINALVGDPILPVGFTPVTAVPTVVRFGERRRARVQGQDGSWLDVDASDLGQYVSEERNPENAKGIRGVEVFVPSSLLADGMCFVDTPGLGSVFSGNTAATHAFIPHIDAALVVIGADPPLAGEELALVETVGGQVRDLIVVLNKADRTTSEERAAAASFAERQIAKRLGRPVGPILELSAIQRLENRLEDRPGNSEQESGWRKLVETLRELVAKSGQQLLYSACKRGITRLSEQLLAVIGEEREALRRPIADSERRIAAMKTTISDAERSMHELGYLFMSEQQRFSDLFGDRHKAFVASVEPRAREEFERAIAPLRYGFGPTYRRRIMKQTQEIAKLHVLPWLSPEQEEGERQYRETSRRFVEMGNAFLRKLAEAGIPELARMPHALDPEAGFRVRSHFTFKEFMGVAQPASPLRWLGDVALVAVGARSVITKQGYAFLESLLFVNSTRVQSDILDRIQESRGRLEADIRKLLHEVSRIAEQALSNAKAAREKGSPAVDAALRKLDELERQVTECGEPGSP
jgi:GTP-binding protein EngB required for normal cell division